MPFERVNIKDILEKELTNKEVSAHFNQIKKEYELIEQIVLVRKQLNITQSELAKKAHVSQQAISRLENEKHIPNMDTLLRIVDGLGLKLVLTER
ncbi:MAG: helix-turn-helix transcriptional regulator [Erysipelotrichaceae bacterium]|jgi:DNA-binding XRE family transcriptional regulator